MLDLDIIRQTAEGEHVPKEAKANWFVWVFRIVVYIGIFFVARTLLLDRVSDVVFWLSAIPIAALAIVTEIYFSSKLQDRTIEEVVGTRILILDNVLAGGESLANRQIEAQAKRDEIAEKSVNTEKGNDGFDKDQDFWEEDDLEAPEPTVSVKESKRSKRKNKK